MILDAAGSGWAKLRFVALASAAVLPTLAHAQAAIASAANPTSIGAPYYVPSETFAGSTGIFRLPSGLTSRRGSLLVSLFRSNIDRDRQDVDFSQHGVAVSFAVTDYIEVFGSLGQARLDIDGPLNGGILPELPHAAVQPGPGMNHAWVTGVSDTLLGVKFGLIEALPTFLAARISLTLPTASGERGLGTGATAVRADLALSRLVLPRLLLHTSLGYELRDSPRNLNLGSTIHGGFAITSPFARYWSFDAEIAARRAVGGQRLSYRSTGDVLLGLNSHFRRVSIRPALGIALHSVGMQKALSDRLGINLLITYDATN